MASKRTVVKKKSAKKSKNATPQGKPSKFFGPAIFKYRDSGIHVDLVKGVNIERETGESDAALEKRAIKQCYQALKEMREDFKVKANEARFKVK